MVLVTGYEEDHNGAMKVLWNLVRKIISRFKVKLLFGDEDNRENFEREAPKHDLIILHGHGFEWCVTGRYNKEKDVYESIYDVYNYKVLKGKVIYAFACESAYSLGYKSAEANNTYIGFLDDILFFLDEKYARIALHPFLVFEELILSGKSPDEAYLIALKSVPRINRSDPMEVFSLQTMFYNLSNFVIIKRERGWASMKNLMLGFLGGFLTALLVRRDTRFLERKK